jgi:hypothetical protein
MDLDLVLKTPSHLERSISLAPLHSAEGETPAINGENNKICLRYAYSA